MDTFFGPYFHFHFELALETWAKASLTQSLWVHDPNHTNSLVSFQWWNGWDPARIWTWVFWMPVRWSYQLTHWSSGIEAEDRWYVYIHRHSSILRLDLFSVGFTLHGECWSNPHSAELLLCCNPSKLGISSHFCMCRQNPVSCWRETFPLLPYFAYLRLKYEGCIYCRVN